MRKIILITMITLDGVMQAPGGKQEDMTNGFEYGGWTAPYSDVNASEFFLKNMQPAEYLLGRNTFEMWENFWPNQDFWPGINEGTKYVLSSTRDKTDWDKTKFLKNLDDIKKLKDTDGVDLHVWGSGQLVQLLLANNLIDELRLITYPVILGQGKKLFAEGIAATAFKLAESHVTPSGVIMANYQRTGEVKIGTVGE